VNCRECEQQLDAYVDGELTPSESAVLHEHLQTCAACGRRFADRESLGRLVRSVPYYPAPDRLRAQVLGTRKRSWFTPTLLAAAAVVALAVSMGGAMIGLVRARTAAAATTAIAEDVVGDHVRALMEQHLFDVRSTDQHTVKPWFLGKLDFSPPVTDLASIGFPLVGGRLDYVAGRPVAALVYQRRQHTINVFVWPAPPRDAPVPPRSIRGFQVQHWTRDEMTFWAVSDVNPADLTEFVHALQR
jgi:anti-sigma factor RsiW